jgi:tetrahydromethanopterin S-methyltransferase subunit G
MYAALRDGRITDYYGRLVVSDAELELGVAEGRLVVDTRLRDALRGLRDPSGTGYLRPGSAPELRFPLPTLVEDAEYAVEAAVLGEADVVRLQRRLDQLEARLQTVEQRLPRRAYRKLTRTAKRVLGARAASA